jgi:hypothetical protein
MHCSDPLGRKLCIALLFRRGPCEFSARLVSPLFDRCSTSARTRRFAALYERNLSVMMRFAVEPFSTAASAIAARLGVAPGSSRIWPSWSTALHNRVFLSGNRDHDFIQMPNIISRRLTTQPTGIVVNELLSPPACRLS